ncbi:MAG TPA: hypothetical protein VGY56_07585 [Verrucomicrobiae bacterium]|nr:hypothetical protein [Verrucomicrobiae bacterium]
MKFTFFRAVSAAWLFLIWPVFLYSQSVNAQRLRNVPRLDELTGKWEIASNLLSLPALNNSLGSGKATWDAVGIGNLSFPPITMTGDSGSLLVDGQVPVLAQTQWFAYQVLRRASAGSLDIETVVRMPYRKRGLLFHLALTNNGTETRTFEMKINLSAATSRHESWGWGVPRPKDAAAQFSAVATHDRRLLLLDDSQDGLANCFSFEQIPDELSEQEHFADWHLTLKPGAGATVNYALAIGDEKKAVEASAERWAKHFDAAFDAVPLDWQQRFDAMFTPGNSVFSGNLPTLVTPDEQVRRVYYMSALSLLSVLRTGFPVAPRVYVSNTPESNCTMMYFWDTREWATVFALLDPVTLKNCLRSWLGKGIYNGYAEEYLTGTLKGPWYSANDYSIFILLNDYLNVTGDRAFLSETVGGKTVLEHMDAMATHWESLVKPGQALADYGGKANLLECVPTYINEVASFNAANVWMMRRVADIEEVHGNLVRAAQLRAKSAKLLPAVLALYEPGQGVWDALHNDGSRVQVRHVFDFATIGLTIPNDLTPKMRGEMTDFVERELLTDHWMRAQSLSDVAAADSNRPDHGPMGAFCAWPAETAAAFCEFGEYDKALDVLHRCAWVTQEGPFSQSRELSSREPDALARITSRGGSPNSHQTYNASNGGSFAETIIRGLFAYQPDFLWTTEYQRNGPPSGPAPRPFRGELLNVRHEGHLENLQADALNR